MPEEVRAGSHAGSIYDLGYRRYEGARLGRRHAVFALYIHSLRTAFGLGRPASAKVIAIGLAVLTAVPAIIQLGVAAVANDVIEIYSASGYYGYVQWILALFVAAVSPELVSRDLRSRTLTLYFSRSLQRSDYVFAKLAALTTSMLLLTLAPQTLLFLGRAFAKNDFWGYTRSNWEDIGPIVAAGVLLSLFMASIGLAIASYTKRRAFATGGVLAYFAISTAVAASLVNTAGGVLQKFALTVSGFHVVRGFTFWLFDERPKPEPNGDAGGPGGNFISAGLDYWVYAVVAVVYIAVCLVIVYRRYRRVSA